jgi:hypothetical protein
MKELKKIKHKKSKKQRNFNSDNINQKDNYNNERIEYTLKKRKENLNKFINNFGLKDYINKNKIHDIYNNLNIHKDNDPEYTLFENNLENIGKMMSYLIIEILNYK